MEGMEGGCYFRPQLLEFDACSESQLPQPGTPGNSYPVGLTPTGEMRLVPITVHIERDCRSKRFVPHT